ncbi:MAG: transcription-repair coupling factor [Dehalococcoidales bacterium]|nr:transcription-repair coupling factor [Dehalococcoidales bacterium]
MKQNSKTVVYLNSARPYIVAALYKKLQIPILFVTAQPEDAKKLQEQLDSWCGEKPVYIYPELDILPYERLTPDMATEMERIRVFSMLAEYSENKQSISPPLVVTSAQALMSQTTAFSNFIASQKNIKVGMSVKPFDLLEDFQKKGYRLENIVEIPGTMSHRGGIVDIFPPTAERPFRLEFFGDDIDSIRSFDATTQRSVEKIEDIKVGPASELLLTDKRDGLALEEVLNSVDLKGCNNEFKQQFQNDKENFLAGNLGDIQYYAALFNRGKIIDYLPDNTLVILDEPSAVEQAVTDYDNEAIQLRSEKIERGELPQNFPTPYFVWKEIEPELNRKHKLSLESFGVEPGLDFFTAPNYAGKLPVFIKKSVELLEQRKRIIIVSHQANRLSDLFEDEDILVVPTEEVKQIPEPGTMVLVQGSLPEGWVMSGETYLFTDAEIFGFVKQRRLVKKQPSARRKVSMDFTADDYVVHVEHGIGKFIGVTMLDTAGTEKEYLMLQYAGNDILYVPSDQIDRVSRYVGAGERTPILSKLGTQEWVRTRHKAKEAAELLARDLLLLYAAREVVPGYAFSRDTVWQQELEAAFPYVETPDQLQTQQDVKQDMEKSKPMDRLVCGDVGYGKTEVAIRAAFKAVMDGKQVAVLVPTTVLAQQHFTTFSERLEAFPVKVEMLSRFRSDREQHEVINGLNNGTVDVCIGTHRLIQKDIIFKNLGLLIIDEEQRFGVNHKEFLKKMRSEVDVLTLSATPIPRTLHMSLVGVRDMSTMETPPEARLPVKTYVAEYNDHLVRESILREIERNGQVFFVHNRVQSIAMIAQNLRELVPEAEIAVGHGQMPEDELEKVMTSFTQGKVDILVCTTIIESGLDMPNANTIIINKADKFGLTQLYQLRGRVGRGANLAYAYFLYDGKRLTEIAHKRLRTIYEATELGAGFGIAMKDLEIRGAGTLLGHRQSGHITAVGFSLYTRLLADAVEEQKAIMAGKEKPEPKLPPPVTDLPLDAFIPEYYVSDVETRLEMYRTLGEIDSVEKIDDVLKEYNDRFGKPPIEVHNLLYIVRIKVLAAKAGIESLTTEEGNIVIRRFQGKPFNAQRFMASLADGVTVGHTQIKIDYKKIGNGWRMVLEGVIKGLLT